MDTSTYPHVLIDREDGRVIAYGGAMEGPPIVYYNCTEHAWRTDSQPGRFECAPIDVQHTFRGSVNL